MGKKVVIAGAGPAGLTAAYELLQDREQHYQVVILEEKDEIGGISRTVRYKGNRMDIGGHRFFSKDEQIMDWWKKQLPVQGKDSFDDKILQRKKPLAAGGPDPEQEDAVMLVRQRVSRIYYKHKFFDYPITLKLQTLVNMGPICTIQAGFSYLFSCIHKLPEDNLENFYVNRFGKILYHMFFEGYTEKLWGRHPCEISADWGAQRVKGLSVHKVLQDAVRKVLGGSKNDEVETSLIEEFIYPKYGPGQLWEHVADEIRSMGGIIIHDAKVSGIFGSEGNINEVEYISREGEKQQLSTDLFMSSIPLKDLVCCMNQVPDEIKEIAAGLPYRDFVTVGLLLKGINLKNQTAIPTLGNIVPDCWIYVQDTSVKVGRIQIFNNWSPYMVNDVERTVWVGLEYFCQEGDSLWDMSETEMNQMAVNELIQMRIIKAKTEVIDAHRERVKKAYPAYFDTYAQIDQMTEWLDCYKNLFCIGRNGQHRYNNMDHSMATAMEAVNNIVNERTGKENVWNVNTERAYHESK